VVEPNELFYVNLGTASGASILDKQGDATVLNDDGPTLSVANASVSEGNSGTKLLTFPVTMSMASPDTVNLSATPFTGAGGTASPYSDFNPPKSDYLSIPPGQTSTSYSLVVNSDMAVEANEVVYVDLYVANGATVFDYRGVGTILNDDGPTLAVNNVALAEGDSGNPLATFTVSLSQAATVPVTYSISTAPSSAVAGSDYLTTSLTGQTIPAGQLSKSFAVPLVGDTVVEPNELFYVNLGTASGASILDKQGDATVLNDDGPTLSVANASVSEGSSGTKLVNVVVSLSKPAAGPVTYRISTGTGTAQAGSDFVAASLAGETIPAGMLSRTFAVTINGDAVAEPNEAFFVTASAVTGATAFDPVAYVVITNDD
jgi:hypothetical protein